MEHKMEDIKIPDFDLSGKVAVITGGTKGLGYGMALTLAKYGADVAISSRTKADCDRVSDEIRSLGRRSLGVVSDVTIVIDNDDLIEKVVAEMGKIDIMICNAGTATTAMAVDMTEDQWDTVIDTDLKGVFFSARAAARAMIKQETGGRIVLVASAAAVSGQPGLTNYCAAKAGVVNMGRALAVEWARYGITVNSLCPGYVPTSINEALWKDPAFTSMIMKHTPLRRLGTIDEVAAAILYLVSDFSGYMTGSFLLIDGGGAAS